METMAKCTKVCEQMHLPVQSGSDAVLKRMYRGYTAAAYLKNIAKLRQFIPNLTLTSDIIVGFPGETEENFQATMALVEAAKFTNSFYFIYSPRPFTKAATWEEQIPEEVAKERLYRLKSLQDRLTIEALNPYLHQEVELLVDGNNHQAEADSSAASLMRPLRGWHGRTRGNWNVHFDLSPEQQLQKGTLVGSLARVKIDRILSHSLQGTLL
jgi:tRNA-2-methylthio-N6-dimethylallyladenosine synthase